jgi:hypothetical protein
MGLGKNYLQGPTALLLNSYTDCENHLTFLYLNLPFC